jgi:hypothetical protein
MNHMIDLSSEKFRRVKQHFALVDFLVTALHG